MPPKSTTAVTAAAVSGSNRGSGESETVAGPSQTVGEERDELGPEDEENVINTPLSNIIAPAESAVPGLSYDAVAAIQAIQNSFTSIKITPIKFKSEVRDYVAYRA